MIYQSVWAHRDSEQTEESIPMLWHGRFLHQRGWPNSIVLVFLEGLDRLSREYRRRLEGVGYGILDCARLAATLVRDTHPGLATLPTSDKYWFLRWSVLGQLVGTGRTHGEAIHIDGDVVLTSDPAMLERDVSGKTFVLQGNPHFAVIGAPHWFDVWATELNSFLQNRREYVAMAMREKESPTVKPRAVWSECTYGPNRFQDQDLIQYLIAAGKLPQARTGDACDSKHYWIQNPLMPDQWFSEQCQDDDRIVTESDGQFLVGHKPLAYLHFLTGFTSYCDRWHYMYRRRAEGSVHAAQHLANLQRPRSRMKAAARYVALSLLKLRRVTKRRAIYEFCFGRNARTGNAFITDIVNSCWSAR